MRKTFLRSFTVLASVLVLSTVALAQRPAAPVNNEPYDAKDLSHLWSQINPNGALTNDVPMTAKALAYYKNQQIGTSNPPVNGPDDTDPLFKCEPSSVPRNYFNGHPLEIAQTPKYTIMMFEAYRNFRLIYMDGRKQPEHPEGTWFGDSVGHWDGNNLIVDTVNFNGRSWIDIFAHPTSDQMKLNEIFSRPDHDHMQNLITITDPVMYTKPWGGTKRWQIANSSWIVEDYMCSPSDVAHLDNDVTNPANNTDNKKK
jgi:hypothetical protein